MVCLRLTLTNLKRIWVEEEVKLYILCNPHNPGGRVWEKRSVGEDWPTLPKNTVFC